MRYAEENLLQRSFGPDARAGCSGAWSWVLDRHIGGSVCARQFRGSASWQAVTSASGSTGCGLRLDTSEPGYDVFRADFSVTTRERIGSVRGVSLTRDKTHSLPFDVRFPRNVEFNSSLGSGEDGGLVIYAPVALVSAIARQAVVSLPPSQATAELDLLVSVQWPFAIRNPTWTKVAGALPPFTDVVLAGAVTLTAATPACPTTANSLCARLWTSAFSDTAQPMRCSFSGEYELELEVDCREGFTNCPLLPSDRRAALGFTLAASRHCADLVATVGLSASLSSFEVAAGGAYVPKRVFLNGQTAVFRMSVWSPAASLRSAEIVSVTVAADGAAGAPLVVFGGQGAPLLDFARVAGGAAAVNVPSVPEFSFRIDQGVLGVPADQSRVFSVAAVVSVQFAANSPQQLLRVTWRLADEPTPARRVASTAALTVERAGASNGSGGDSASSSSAWGAAIDSPLLVLGVAAFALAVVVALAAAVVIRRRRRAAHEQVEFDPLGRTSSTASLPEKTSP